MRRRLLLLVAWYVIVGLVLVACSRGATTENGLARVIEARTGLAGVSVVCERQPPNIAGRTWKSERRVSLQRIVCADLFAAPKVRANSGFSVWVLTHESGHLIHCDYSECDITTAERAADCYALATWKRYARSLGFGRAQIRLLGRQIAEDALQWRCKG